MNEDSNKHITRLIPQLQERARELRCLYQIEEALCKDCGIEDGLREVIEIIPSGWSFPDVCVAEVQYDGKTYRVDEGVGIWTQSAEIVVQGIPVGAVHVHYTEDLPTADRGPFRNEEARLIDTIAARLAVFLLHRRLRRTFSAAVSSDHRDPSKREWRLALELLRKTDQKLLHRVSRKMLNFLNWKGIEEARPLLKRLGALSTEDERIGDLNQPMEKVEVQIGWELTREVFRVADNHLFDERILELVQGWIHEERTSFIVRAVNGQMPLDEIVNAVRRYRYLSTEERELSDAARNGVRVGLIRRFFTEQLEFINIAKQQLEIDDFFELLEHVIVSPGCQGKLGGKSAGLFLASKILQRVEAESGGIGEVRTPKTWHITSDGVLDFLHHNEFEEVFETKYRSIEQVRQEYPHVVRLFKHSSFPPEVVSGLSMALDDFGDAPLIVRSSSLLEDRFGSAFSGKYKSLFLANQGTKKQKLTALLNAVSEIYASTFGPDPIEYRAERGLLDFDEEMGILIQEVVGKRAGKYFFPAFAGVAFSFNEFRWSPRIEREDGLLRLVPGLGTRAVDRLGDDYPILIAPGKAKLRVNVTLDEVVRYSPSKMDVINLEKNCFETKEVKELIKECGAKFPGISQVVSVFRDGMLHRPNPILTDFERDDFVVTLDGLLNGTPFIQRLRAILDTLETELKTPVDIEFAHDGEHFYLLQCRPQSSGTQEGAVSIPASIPADLVLFSAEKFVSNGRVDCISHIVYVDPEAYDAIESIEELVAVGEAVGKLNKLLPRRTFILMGPGRWGSRGDIKLGVKVTYSDINNSAMLIEIARKKGNYVPDLSFGTHFFQDLVEASIRYLPLYPDDDGIVFNDAFFSHSPNVLSELLPECASLGRVLRVIDVTRMSGTTVTVLMDAQHNRAVAMLGDPERGPVEVSAASAESAWRLEIAREIGAHLDASQFGIKAAFVVGSAANNTALASHDLDLLFQVSGTSEQASALEDWLEPWDRALQQLASLRSDHRISRFLHVFIVRDEDLVRQPLLAENTRKLIAAGRPLLLGGALRSAPLSAVAPAPIARGGSCSAH
ncbi:MAG: PEP/pyruvate-binding domain-containing protein [Myxococcota bacterium]|jgi:hypothetical protein|nr:PEP/pyruvate-binding domain-containing protein [Myxococcota bacterium]